MGGLPQGQQELTLQGMVMIGNSQAHFSGKTHTFYLAHLNSGVFPASIYTYETSMLHQSLGPERFSQELADDYDMVPQQKTRFKLIGASLC